MTDANTVAEPSAATTPVQYDSWDEKGNPIVSKKEPAASSAEPPQKQDSAPAPTPETKATPEPEGKSAAESGTAPKQEKKGKQTAEERIQELIGERESERRERRALEERLRKLESAPQPTPKTDATKQAAQTYAEWRKGFKPKEWIEQWTKDHPNGVYEDAIADLADYQSDIRLAYQRYEDSQRLAAQQTSEMLKQTIAKYPDADAKVRQAAADLVNKAPMFLQGFVNRSEVMTEMLYALSDPKTLDGIIEAAKNDQYKALDILYEMQSDIKKEIAKTSESAAGKPAVPEKKSSPDPEKPRAPKPPPEVGGRGTSIEDAQVAAARSGDFSAFAAEENRKKFVRA